MTATQAKFRHDDDSVVVIVGSGAGPPPQQIWYYCQDPMRYYPTVQNCNSNWQVVPGSVLPPPNPQP